MSRPRSTDPGVPITISIPNSLKMRLDKELSFTQSRSKWITKAIQNKFEGKKAYNIGDVSNFGLISAFHGRVCGCMAQDACATMKLLKSMLPIEEIEAEQ